MIGTTGAIAAAVNAGFIAFAVGLTNSAIYGKFDFKTFLRSVLIAAITAGALDYLGDITINTDSGPVKLRSLGLGGPDGKEVVAWDQRIIKYLVQATVSTGIQGLVNGNTRGLEQAFLASLVNQAGADLATQIGLTWKGEDQRFMNALAHATLGCAMAAAKRQECLDGAVGAAIAAVGNDAFCEAVGRNPQYLQLLSGSIAAIVVKAMGGNAQTGLDAALNETLNNYLKHTEVEQLMNALAKCGNDAGCRESAFQVAAEQSIQNDRRLLLCKVEGTCDQLVAEYREGMLAIDALALAGVPASDLNRIWQLQNAGTSIVANRTYDKICLTPECIERARFANGLARSQTFVTPLGCWLEPVSAPTC